MIERWNEPIEQWARDRGLEYVPDGLLPAWSKVLAAGLGAGTHRAGLVTHRTARTTQAVGGLKKWPERGTHHLCRGALPGSRARRQPAACGQRIVHAGLVGLGQAQSAR